MVDECVLNHLQGNRGGVGVVLRPEEGAEGTVKGTERMTTGM